MEDETLSVEPDLSRAERWLLYETFLVERRDSDLIDHTMGLVKALGREVPSREEFDSAFASLLSRRLIQVIDRRAIERITSGLRDDPAIGPIEGVPAVGVVDFTKEGAACWSRIQCGFMQSVVVPLHGDYGRRRLYSTKRAWLLEYAREELDHARIGEVVEIGSWRGRWWQKYPHGYYVEVLDRETT